jgi:hypothetical protein
MVLLPQSKKTQVMTKFNYNPNQLDGRLHGNPLLTTFKGYHIKLYRNPNNSALTTHVIIYTPEGREICHCSKKTKRSIINNVHRYVERDIEENQSTVKATIDNVDRYVRLTDTTTTEPTTRPTKFRVQYLTNKGDMKVELVDIHISDNGLQIYERMMKEIGNEIWKMTPISNK